MRRSARPSFVTEVVCRARDPRSVGIDPTLTTCERSSAVSETSSATRHASVASIRAPGGWAVLRLMLVRPLAAMEPEMRSPDCGQRVMLGSSARPGAARSHAPGSLRGSGRASPRRSGARSGSDRRLDCNADHRKLASAARGAPTRSRGRPESDDAARSRLLRRSGRRGHLRDASRHGRLPTGQERTRALRRSALSGRSWSAVIG